MKQERVAVWQLNPHFTLVLSVLVHADHSCWVQIFGLVCYGWSVSLTALCCAASHELMMNARRDRKREKRHKQTAAERWQRDGQNVNHWSVRDIKSESFWVAKWGKGFKTECKSQKAREREWERKKREHSQSVGRLHTWFYLLGVFVLK